MESIHILLIEDNEGDILLTTEALAEARIMTKLTVLKDGKEAIDFLRKVNEYTDACTPDLILLDVNLPRVTGHEVLKFIKQDDANKHIPVIMLTTSSSPVDVSKAFGNRANWYITKPVDVVDFLSVVQIIENFWIAIVKQPTINTHHE